MPAASAKKANVGFCFQTLTGPVEGLSSVTQVGTETDQTSGHQRLRDWSPRAAHRSGRKKKKRMRGGPPGLDFCLAPLYRMLDIPTDLFTPVRALARVVGWTAHVLEQYADSHLPKLAGRYKGPKPRPFPPVAERK